MEVSFNTGSDPHDNKIQFMVAAMLFPAKLRKVMAAEIRMHLNKHGKKIKCDKQAGGGDLYHDILNCEWTSI